jgi:hypothetical protein
MANIYTPGLKVSDYSIVRKRRILPLKGTVTCKLGDVVKPDSVVAETFLPGNVVADNLANKLGVDAPEVEQYLLKKINEPFEKGEIYAMKKGFFGLLKTELVAPFKGSVESISKIIRTGNSQGTTYSGSDDCLHRGKSC